jgi:endonuclease/exonuclease/phosphatase family metal-dependent hydrolase
MQLVHGIPIRVISHNIRYATQSPFKGEKPWPIRRPRLCAELTFHSLHPESFICLQEVLHSQLEEIHESLNKEMDPCALWQRIGVGRDDGKAAGEFGPIFYRPAVWDLAGWKTVWLSETPERPSKGWDAALPRIVTIGFFQHKATQRRVVVMNTHFDHQGVRARAMSAKLILKLVEEHQAVQASSAAMPVLLAGDFNSTPDDAAYQIMTDPASVMVDVRDSIPKGKRYGHQMTFTSFGELPPSIIDFIFSNKNDVCLARSYGVLENRFDDGIYVSDHRAVVGDFLLT